MAADEEVTIARNRTRARHAVASIVVGALVLTACGGDGDDDAGERGSDAFCAAVADVRATFVSVLSADLSEPGELERAKTLVIEVDDSLETAEAEAPDEALEKVFAQARSAYEVVKTTLADVETADDFRAAAAQLGPSVEASLGGIGDTESDVSVRIEEVCGAD